MTLEATVYAGFWRRAVAFWLDSLLLNGLSVLFLALFLRGFGLSASDLGGFEAQLMSVGMYACLAFLYYSVMHFRWGATLGKKLLGVKVLDAETGQGIAAGQSMLRSVTSVLSYLPFAMGYFMAIWDSKKRTLHDRLSGTVCIRTRA